jgi:hypothetical protein
MGVLRGARFQAGATVLTVVLLLATALASQAPAAPKGEDRFRLWPAADTYVDSSLPTESFGRGETIAATGSPKRVSFVRFDVPDLQDRTVTAVELRVYPPEGDVSAGRVFSTRPRAWSEEITWAERPKKDERLAAFGASTLDVSRIPLPVEVVQDRKRVSLALDSPDSGSTWSSREGWEPPELIVSVERRKGLTLDGLSHVAHERVASSDPTYYPTQHRVALTHKGRLLAVHGRHSEGVQLAWRDPGGGWQTDTRGAVEDGLLLRDEGTGDRPASIVVGRDPEGEKHAWVVWAAPNIGLVPRRVIGLRRLSKLDAPNGPKVGPLVTLVDGQQPEPSAGVARVDVAIEPAERDQRLVITWLASTEDGTTHLMTGWVTELGKTATPSLSSVRSVLSGSQNRAPTLEADRQGTRLIVRDDGGRLRTFRHDATDPLTQWDPQSPGIALPTNNAGFPAAALLDGGDTVVAIESVLDADILTIQRWDGAGDVTTLGTLQGYREPTITTHGRDAWVVAIRSADGAVISRHVAGPGSDEAIDIVEIDPDDARNASHPNALRSSDGRLRFIVRGTTSGPVRSSVLGFQRSL